MPNVPNLPGVPALASFSEAPAALLTQDAVPPIAGATTPTWAILLDGSSVIDADSFLDFELKQDNPISTYPVEGGAFVSYDKVLLPREIRCRFCAGGTEANRQTFLDSVDAVINTTDLYDVATPEQVYSSFNFTHRDFKRSARNGVGLITIDLWLEEVRQTATAAYQNTQQPGEADQVGNGNAQAQPPSSAIQDNVSTGAWAIG